MPVGEHVAECDISVDRLQRYAHTIGFGICKHVLCQWESMIRYALSPWLGVDDMLIPSASVYYYIQSVAVPLRATTFTTRTSQYENERW
jgi:hypothetical protein